MGLDISPSTNQTVKTRCRVMPDRSTYIAHRRTSQGTKERAQYIFAFGDPRHRFHMERMQREQQSDYGAGPTGPCRPVEKHKQCDCRERVEEQVDQVACAASQSEELIVQ